MNACPESAARGQRGMALVLTLLIITLLVTAVLEFDRSTRTALKAAGNFRDGMKAFHLASSGIAAAQAVLKDDKLKPGSKDDLTELWATPFPPYPVGDGTVAVAIQDEGGKINVNALVTKDGKLPKDDYVRKQLQELFRLKGVDPDLVDAIVDWLDRDDIPEARGAETAYYQGLDLPYQSRNGQMETLAELYLVKGITDEVYRVINPYLTVYWNPKGASNILDLPAINVNTADPLVLQSLPQKVGDEFRFPFTAEVVDKIVDTRPFVALNSLKQVPGVPDFSAIPPLQVESRFFSIYAEGEANGVKKGVIAITERTPEPVLRYWRLSD